MALCLGEGLRVVATARSPRLLSAAAGAVAVTGVGAIAILPASHVVHPRENEEMKQRAERVARAVDHVEQVVVNLQVHNGSMLGAASPPTEREVRLAATPGGRAHPLLSRLPGLARIQGDPVGTPQGPFTAYDRGGRVVATIYTISTRELAQHGVDDLRTRGFRIDHVAIYPIAAHPDVPDLQYHVVLWHVSRTEAARLE